MSYLVVVKKIQITETVCTFVIPDGKASDLDEASDQAVDSVKQNVLGDYLTKMPRYEYDVLSAKKIGAKVDELV